MAKLKIAVLDVGHGDFIYAETPLGDRLVIDVGTGDVVPSRFLRNIHSITELQISHPHTDHFDDIIAVAGKSITSFRCPNLNSFQDQTIGWKKSDKAKIQKLRDLKANIVTNNSAVKVGNGFSHTAWYPSDIDPNDPNTASIVTTLSYNGVKMLFGGDLPACGWKTLLKRSDFVSAISGTTIFKVPHHGRQEGCCEELFALNGFTPSLCIVSDKALDKDNRNTVATDWYSRRALGCNVMGCSARKSVLTTRNDGSIFIEINDQEQWSVYPHTPWGADN